jgi:dihydroxyacetone kinase-like protein
MPVLAGPHMLTVAKLVEAVTSIDAGISAIRDELNAADRRLGDGDTGMTVAQVVAAWSRVTASLPSDVGTALLNLGSETSRASGSSLSAVLAMFLSTAGRSVLGKQALSRSDIVMALSTAIKAVCERSGAAAGDKCVIDSLLAIERHLHSADDSANLLTEAVKASQVCLLEFRDRESKLGRARMYGARSIGHDDPGMLAVVRLLSYSQGKTG